MEVEVEVKVHESGGGNGSGCQAYVVQRVYQGVAGGNITFTPPVL